MTFSPPTLLAVRALMRQKTGLPAVALGIQHFTPQGGGYHEGNDLLRQAGREHTDYSKRESDRDRPGSDAACGLDVGRFSVQSKTGLVDNHRMTRWMLAQLAADTVDSRWIREIIYSLDDKTVKRWDRLKIRSTGDSSHRTHEHYSSFRDDIGSPHILGLFTRFWVEMDAVAPPPTPVHVKRRMRTMVEYLWHLPKGAKYAVERPYHTDPARQWEELGTYQEAVAVAKVNADSTEITLETWNRRKAVYVAT